MSYFPQTNRDILGRIAKADDRYGPFASTHEALGVCSEEWDELRAAIHANDFDAIMHEALDLAAALIRLDRWMQTHAPKGKK